MAKLRSQPDDLLLDKLLEDERTEILQQVRDRAASAVENSDPADG